MTRDAGDYAGSIYSTPADTEIRRDERGALRVLAVTPCCKTSAELEACELEILLDRMAAEVGGYSEVEFVEIEDEVELSMAECEALRASYTADEWALIAAHILQKGD